MREIRLFNDASISTMIRVTRLQSSYL